MTITLVRQRRNDDCAVAALAMFTGRPYETVARDVLALPPDQRLGLAMREDAVYRYVATHGQRQGLRFVRLFHPPGQAEGQECHVVVMDERGRVFDPDRDGFGTLGDYTASGYTVRDKWITAGGQVYLGWAANKLLPDGEGGADSIPEGPILAKGPVTYYVNSDDSVIAGPDGTFPPATPGPYVIGKARLIGTFTDSYGQDFFVFDRPVQKA